MRRKSELTKIKFPSQTLLYYFWWWGAHHLTSQPIPCLDTSMTECFLKQSPNLPLTISPHPRACFRVLSEQGSQVPCRHLETTIIPHPFAVYVFRSIFPASPISRWILSPHYSTWFISQEINHIQSSREEGLRKAAYLQKQEKTVKEQRGTETQRRETETQAIVPSSS